MSSQLERVLAHASRELRAAGGSKQSDLVPLYRKFLKIESHRLRIRHNAGGGGLELATARADLLDVVLRHLFDGAMEFTLKQGSSGAARRLALVAIGGYGRAELSPASDVDIMFLHDSGGSTLPPFLKEVITQMLYLLWDVGFKVGHSTRTVASAVSHANEDMLSKTSLLESRLVCGDRELFEKFQTTFEARCVRARGMAEAYVLWRLRNQSERHEKNGGTVFMQEPNIKNGLGGLRDYQNLMWVAHFQVGISSLRELVTRKYMSESERRSLKKAYDFLIRVRNELHYLNERSTDTLTLFFQGQVANRFRYPGKNIVLRSEAFMRDYFQHARTIYLVTEAVSRRLSLPDHDGTRKKPALLGFLGHRKGREEFDGFVSGGGVIHFESRDVFNEDPMRLLRVFSHAQQRALVPSPELQQLIRRRLRLIDRTFLYSRSARDIFLSILSRKGQVGRILRMMHEVDVLGRYLPEFGALTCLVQHEFFHRYTADEHTLVCIEKLDQIIDTTDPKRQRYSEVFQNLATPESLYLALLLHDVGKAHQERSHTEIGATLAHRACRRMGLPIERRREVVLLVDHHVSLSQIAQTRNLDDPATIAAFAGIIHTRENLDMLLLLTLADAQGTTGEAWSDWKESLALHLYTATARYLANGGEDPVPIREIITDNRAVAEKKLPKDFAEEIAAHFSLMPERYFLLCDGESVVEHIRLFRKFIAMRYADPEQWLGAALEWRPHADQGHSQVSLVTWDRKALFQRIAGSFAVAQVNILSADIYTRGDDLVLDIFRVCGTNFEPVTNPRTIALVEKTLLSSLSGEDFDFTELIAKARRTATPGIDFPTKIAVMNDLSPVLTVVEVRTPDRLGLLHDLLAGFHKADINIELSRISTEKGAAIDTFYVTDREGGKIENDKAIRELQQHLRDAALPPPLE